MQSPGPTDGSVVVRLVFKEEIDALSAVRKFNGETADGRTLIVRSVGGQPVNLAARLDVGPAKDGSVDALITSSSTSFVLRKMLVNSVELIGAVGNCVRMTLWLKIREPRCWFPHQVPTQRTMFSNRPGVVEMAGVVVAVAQNVGARVARVAVSPPEWTLIDSCLPLLLCFAPLLTSLLTQCCTMLIVPSVISSFTQYEAHVILYIFSRVHSLYNIREIPANCEIG